VNDAADIDVLSKNGCDDDDNNEETEPCFGPSHDTTGDDKNLALGSLNLNSLALDFNFVFAVLALSRLVVDVGMHTHASAERTKRVVDHLSEMARTKKTAKRFTTAAVLFIFDRLEVYWRVVLAVAIECSAMLYCTALYVIPEKNQSSMYDWVKIQVYDWVKIG